MPQPKRDTRAAAAGRWPEILCSLGGLSADQLCRREGPCPACGGDTRFRWDQDDGDGGWHCSHCGGKDRQGGGGNGVDLLIRLRGWSYPEALQHVDGWLGGAPPLPPRPRPARPKPRRGQSAELHAFDLLERAGELADGEVFSPAKAKGAAYSSRWLRWSEANPDQAASIQLEVETVEGEPEPPEMALVPPGAHSPPPPDNGVASNHSGETYATPTAKPIRLEAGQLLAMLRQQAENGQSIRWNTFHQQIEIDGETLEGAELFYLTLADRGFKVSKELAVDSLVKVAKENPYDPVRLYLEHVAATVEPGYIDSLATAYLRPEDKSIGNPTLYDYMLKCTLIGAVRRAFNPGAKHDTACILSGEQGSRKSTFWSVLGGPFFSDSLGDLTSKDDLLKLHRSWIMEWAEFDHVTTKKAAGMIKAFLTTQRDLFRVPYGRAVEPHPRRGVIVGSTNRSEGFLLDDTGNRRFWVIPITLDESRPIATDTLASERDSIWSAAVHACRAGAPNHLPPDLAKAVARENESYRVSSPWCEPIRSWLEAPANGGRVITSELLLSEAIQRPVERQTRADQMQVGSIMRELGWTKRRLATGPDRRWIFYPPS